MVITIWFGVSCLYLLNVCPQYSYISYNNMTQVKKNHQKVIVYLENFPNNPRSDLCPIQHPEHILKNSKTSF